MFRHIFVTFISVVALIAAGTGTIQAEPPDSFSGSSAGPSATCDPATLLNTDAEATNCNVSGLIWSGLYMGSNFDLNFSPFTNGQPAASASQPSKPPEPDQNGRAPSQTPAPSAGGTYAALGDSVPAGLGLGGTVDGDAGSGCGRTAEGYPAIVAQAKHLRLIDLACSGASMGDLFTQQHTNGTSLEPQLDGAFASGTPKLITITAGANDVHWSQYLQKCYTGTCGTTFDNVSFQALLASLNFKLQTTLQEIQHRTNGSSTPKVAVTGYYDPLASCGSVIPQFTPSEIQWAQDQTKALNDTLRTVSNKYSFAHYVPVDFNGHDLCSINPWVQGPGDPAPFHPTAQGQQAIAQAIL